MIYILFQLYYLRDCNLRNYSRTVSRISKILRIGTEAFLNIYVLAAFDLIFKYCLLYEYCTKCCARLTSFIGYKLIRIPIVRFDYLVTDRLFLV